MATEALVLNRLPAAEAEPTLGRSRVLLGRTSIDQVDFDQALESVRGFLLSNRPHQVVTVNLDFVSIAERNAEFRDTINQADLAVADGMPLVWLARLRGDRSQSA